jgi:ParB family chromosome partitioning protein
VSTTRRLGRGFAEIVGNSTQPTQGLASLPVGQIKPGRYQPRQQIDPAALEELKASIKECGIIQPIVVRPLTQGEYELVAGERRWRAAQALGMAEIPAIVRSLSDQETLEYSLVENLQRNDLNPIEEAMGYARLMAEFGHTHDQLGERLGKDRSTITNLLRLLKLPEVIQAAIRSGALTQGHAKVLLGVEVQEQQLALSEKACTEGLSVRQLEALTLSWQPSVRRQRIDRAPEAVPEIRAIEEELRAKLGTKVMVDSRKRGGRIVIQYFSDEDLTRLLELLGVKVSVS